MSSRALVVEGGAMRGIFAAGVLDAFLENEYREFDFAVGVSAGSTNLIGYLAGDHGRSRHIITDHACRAEFINWQRFMSGGHLCDVHWLWHQSLQDVPLNLGRHWQSQTPLWVVTTSVEDGAPRYHLATPDNLNEIMTASCSIPFAYRQFPTVNGHPMTDGGLGDSIPVRWAYEQGARDITVVLSRHQGYRKKPSALTPLLKPWVKDLSANRDCAGPGFSGEPVDHQWAEAGAGLLARTSGGVGGAGPAAIRSGGLTGGLRPSG